MTDEKNEPTSWEPGGPSPNPSGRPNLGYTLTEARKLTAQEFISAAIEILQMSVTETRELVENPYTPNYKRVVASVIARCIAKGDMISFSLILDRAIGTVKQKHEFTTDSAPPDLSRLSMEELDAYHALIAKTEKS